MSSPQNQPVFSWSVHRAREEPRRAVTVAVFIIAAVVLSYLGFRVLLWSLLGGLLLVGAASEFLFPITCRLTPDGAEKAWLAGRTSLPWTRVRRAVWDARGLYLSPFARPNRLDGIRGLFLPFAADQPRESVTAWVRQHLQEVHAHAETG